MHSAIVAPGATIPEVRHHLADVNGTTLHYVSAGSTGSPILLVHGFPESWWAFHRLIPLLAARHRVFAVDLRGFGDSAVAPDRFTSADAAADLHALITELGVGPVHIAAQDIAGGSVYRLITEHPEDARSLIATEMGLAGFGLEGFGDITHGGSWHIGVLAAPGVAEMLLTGREREVLGTWAFPAMSAAPDAITPADIEEFARTYSRKGGWKGAVGLYQSMLAEGTDFQDRARNKLTLPTLAIGGFGGRFTEDTVTQIVEAPIDGLLLDGVGHYVALEAPDRLAEAIDSFLATQD
ncbi:alpha/beta hydrolase [uncultured Microbacterium sp.]|uniref:alpha/beta fold hydrolase n=1 Tax=uncultured Microbacterium sp. TaxID=191216 RepID=UPI0028D0A128|nr:alpha/beta hydrolase [uncultured Microbacterium sp.]